MWFDHFFNVFIIRCSGFSYYFSRARLCWHFEQYKYKVMQYKLTKIDTGMKKRCEEAGGVLYERG